MPKDADILTNLFPVKDNIYWLYRYHCRQVYSLFIIYRKIRYILK